jgi:hypothetical protein
MSLWNIKLNSTALVRSRPLRGQQQTQPANQQNNRLVMQGKSNRVKGNTVAGREVR